LNYIRRFYFVLTFLILLISPFAWKFDFANYLPIPIANYFTPKYGSLFPIFPWLAFIFAGSIACSFYLNSISKNEEEKFFKNIFYVSISFIIIGIIFLFSGLDLFESVSMIRPNPFFFLSYRPPIARRVQ